MNKGYAAYTKNMKEGFSGRELEAYVLNKSASLLHKAMESLEKGDQSLVDEAIEYNKKLWLVLSSDISDDTNKLPYDMKSNLLNISIFIFKRSMEMLASPTVNGIKPLIDINRNIAAGLNTIVK